MKLARMPDGSPEIFHTIQGEGSNTGLPTVFIRSSLCNLHCHWCDTAYTWNWEDTNFDTEFGEKFKRDEQIITIDPGDLAAQITREYACSNFVFTGGEPLLQEKAWLQLMQEIRGASPAVKFHFEIETNGTLLPGDDFLNEIDQLNISPKLTNSGVPESLCIKPEALTGLAKSTKADFKFVIETEADFAEVRSLISTFEIAADHVFLMPKAISADELEANSGKVADLCKEHGYRFSDRLHIRLFGAKRGV